MGSATVTISYTGNDDLTVNPPNVEIRVGDGDLPDSVKWVIQNSSGTVVVAAIRWKKDAAFTSYGVGTGSARELVGLDPVEVAATTEFEYGVELLGVAGNVVAHIDPKIIVKPRV